MRYLGKYVDVTDPDGPGLSGLVVKEEKGVQNGKEGYWIVVDYGYGHFITEETKVVVKPLVGAPRPNVRTTTYGGRGIYTLSGDVITVLSSVTQDPGLFFTVDDIETRTKLSQELSLEHVIALQETFRQFLDDVRVSYPDGQERIDQAAIIALGKRDE